MPSGNFRPTGPALILLSGLPGAGKTTFAHALADALEFTHVESDALRRALSATPLYTAGESAAVFAQAERLAATALEAGRHALVDATNLSNRDRKRFLRLADRTAATLVAVRITVPEDVIRERLATPRAGFSQATNAIYDLMRDRATRFTPPSIVVDTRYPLGPSIDLVLRLIHDGGE